MLAGCKMEEPASKGCMAKQSSSPRGRKAGRSVRGRRKEKKMEMISAANGSARSTETCTNPRPDLSGGP